MELNKLDRLANKGEPMPENLTSSEIRYYISVREIYSTFHKGFIDKIEAQKEKETLLKALASERAKEELWEKFCKTNNLISAWLSEYKAESEQEKKFVETFAKIWDGRITEFYQLIDAKAEIQQQKKLAAGDTTPVIKEEARILLTNGNKANRLQIKGDEECVKDGVCKTCGREVGRLHEKGCAEEICPVCKEKLRYCNCWNDYSE